MKPTYRAMQVSQPGVLELVERPTPAPGAGEVLIAVEACGMCGADIGDIDRADPTLQRCAVERFCGNSDCNAPLP